MQFRSIVLFSTNKMKFTHKKYSSILLQLVESADIHMQVSAHAQSQARVHKHIYIASDTFSATPLRSPRWFSW